VQVEEISPRKKERKNFDVHNYIVPLATLTLGFFFLLFLVLCRRGFFFFFSCPDEITELWSRRKLQIQRVQVFQDLLESLSLLRIPFQGVPPLLLMTMKQANWRLLVQSATSGQNFSGREKGKKRKNWSDANLIAVNKNGSPLV
jgi:hypothetical protein